MAEIARSVGKNPPPYLAQEKQVLVAPGAYFGAPGTLRIAYGMESARLGEALERLEIGTQAYFQGRG